MYLYFWHKLWSYVLDLKFYVATIASTSGVAVAMQMIDENLTEIPVFPLAMFVVFGSLLDSYFAILKAVHPKFNDGRWAFKNFKWQLLFLLVAKLAAYLLMAGGIVYGAAAIAPGLPDVIGSNLRPYAGFGVGLVLGGYEMISALGTAGQIYPGFAVLSWFARQKISGDLKSIADKIAEGEAA